MQGELVALRAEHRALRETLDRLDQRLASLEHPPTPVAAASPPPLPNLRVELPQTPPTPPMVTLATRSAREEFRPPPLPVAPLAPPVTLPVVHAAPPSPPVASLPPSPPVARPAAASLEQRIGEVWLVRVGIVALLTGLVLLAGYLYQNVVPHLGPLGKVVLLYLGAGALTGAGAFLERRAAAEKGGGLQNYARVLLGGGLAAVYYVTYAAHYLPGLRVIGSPLLAGMLLLGWAGFMVWLADRRGSQTLATFALLLAYYTAAVSEVGGFTLFSNLALTAAAVFLLRRHRWAAFSFASLLATYGSYGFWRFYGAIHGPVLGSLSEPRLVLQPERFWLECSFLALYWALFTAAAFFPSAPVGESLPSRRKVVFVSLNHGLLFALVSGWVHSVYPGHFWQWSLGFGVALLALGEARRLSGGRLVLDDATAGSSRLLGIVFFTGGVLAYFTGWQLALALAAETVVLTLAAGASTGVWERRLLLGATCAVGALAAGTAVLRLASSAQEGGLRTTGVATGAALVFAAFWCGRVRRAPGQATVPAEAGLRFSASWLALLGAGTWLSLILCRVTDPTERGVTLAGGAIVLTFLAPALRLGALAAAGLAFFAAALDLQLLDDVGTPPAATRLLMIPALAVGGAGLVLCQWWEREKTFGFPPWASRLAQGFTAFGALVVLEAWLRPQFSPATWMAVGAALSVGVLMLGLRTRSWATAAAGQVPLWTALGIFVSRALTYPPAALHAAGEHWPALAAVVATMVSAAAWRRFACPAVGSPAAAFVRGAQLVYETLAVFLFAAWVMRFAAPGEPLLLLALGGGGLLVLGVELRNRRWLTQGLTLLGFGLLVYTLSSLAQAPARLSWWNLGGFFVLAGLGEFLHRRQGAVAASVAAPPWVRAALAAAAGLGVWRWLTDVLTARVGNGWTLAVGWSFLAAGLFAVGLGLRERVYRWLGLGILGVTLGRIALVEFWNADTLHRILGLLAFSAVLLGLGFVYNRFGEKMKHWM